MPGTQLQTRFSTPWPVRDGPGQAIAADQNHFALSGAEVQVVAICGWAFAQGGGHRVPGPPKHHLGVERYVRYGQGHQERTSVQPHHAVLGAGELCWP